MRRRHPSFGNANSFRGMTTLELIYVNAGGGHRSAATAFAEAVRREGRPWTVRMTNLFDVLAPLDFPRRLTGVAGSELYNRLLRRGWTLGFSSMLAPLHALIRRSHDAQVALLMKHWENDPPDAVVSFIPHFNRCLQEASRRVTPAAPLITILTDLADFPPDFWIEQWQPQYFVCGTDRAREQALGEGHPPERVFQTSGMILNPRFYDADAEGQAGSLAELGLDPALPTAMMMFGGEGSAAMLRIARLLDASGLEMQIIAVCGRNAKLEASMRAAALTMPMFVTGFTDDVARLMRLSDFFIGKAGPASISEALAMGLPVIIERNRFTMPQERYNAEWVTEGGFGIPVRSFRRGVVTAASAMLDPARRRQFAENIRAHRNRAVFEIPAIVARILADDPLSSAPDHAGR
jgi:UDP-N-acetylglucosamine:LPS N-acetylglucosamine transferase